MPHSSHQNEFFDVYYDISESLFDRIHELMDHHYNATPRTSDGLTALKSIRNQVVQAVAAIENVKPESIYHQLEEVRSFRDESGPEQERPPFLEELSGVGKM